MKDLALRLIKTAASYGGSAAASTAMAGAMTGAIGPLGLVSLGGVIAVALITDAAAQHADKNARLVRIETWLKELIRRHGRLDAAVAAIADGRESDTDVDRQRAAELTTLFSTADADLESLLASQQRIESLVVYVGQWLAGLGAQQQKQLEAMTETLGNVHAEVAALHGRFDTLEASRFSDAALSTRAVDENDNARLRTAHLRRLLDTFEFEAAREFASRCERWLSSTAVDAQFQARLYEPIIDEAVVRLRLARGPERSTALQVVRQLIESTRAILDRLEESDRLSLSSLIAYATALVDGSDRGLEELEGRSDPYAIRRKLGILLDADRVSEAADLVRAATPTVEWVDKSVVALVRNEELELAREQFEWMIANVTGVRLRRGRMLFAEAILLRHADNDDDGPHALAHARNAIQPVLDEVLQKSTPEDESDAAALRLGLEIEHRLENPARLRELGERLQARPPLDFTLAHLALRGLIEAQDDWPQRLRNEQAKSFERDFIAVALEGVVLDNPAIAFRSALQLAGDAESVEDKERLHGLLVQLVQRLSPEEERAFKEVEDSLIDSTCRQARLWSAARLLKAGDLSAAQTIVDETRDDSDYLWLQISGQLNLQRGAVSEAVTQLTEAARLLDHPDTLGNAIGLAISHKEWAAARPVAERLVTLTPYDEEAVSALAAVYHHLQRPSEAAELFVRLFGEHSDEVSYAQNAASNLVLAGRPDEAVDVLKSVCSGESPPLQAVVNLSQLLVERGEPKAAFELLQLHRSRLWGYPEFVGTYWSTAFAAEEEALGHEAFLQMRSLQETGVAPSNVIVEKSLDDLIELSKQNAELEEKRARLLFSGQVPWLMIEEARNRAAVVGWQHRTSARRWLYEEPVSLANSCIYASNVFTVRTSRSQAELEHIAGPSQDTEVVADLTALITVQRLGLLEQMLSYCGRIHIPTPYLFNMFADHARMRPHQPSYRSTLLKIRQAMPSGAVQVEQEEALPVLDEHSPSGADIAPTYHLADLVAALQARGLLSAAELQKISSLARRPTLASGTDGALEVGDRVTIALSTLSTIDSSGLLPHVLEHLRVHVSSDDHQVIAGDLEGFDIQEKLAAEHEQLWGMLRDDPRVEKHPVTVPDSEAPRSVSILSCVLAEQLKQPLLVDDRCIQALVLNSRQGATASAFATNHLVTAMMRAGTVSIDVGAASLLQLIEWRYRFIVPSADVLAYWAKGALSSPPGRELQVTARYLQVCMRDPGLLSGMEATEPPSCIALKLYHEIEMCVGEYLGHIWSDLTIQEDIARELTVWSLTHLLPRPPVALEPAIRGIADLGHGVMLSTLLTRLVSARDMRRSHRAINCVGETLGVPETQLHREALEILRAIRGR